jgi:SAM-dependent methyltransferase
MEYLEQCPLCKQKHSTFSLIEEVDSWKMMRCSGCSLGLLNPRPTLSEIKKFYKSSFFSLTPDIQIGNFSDLVQLIKTQERFKQKLRILQYVTRNYLKFKALEYSSRDSIGKLSLIEGLFFNLLKRLIEPVIFLPFIQKGRILDIGFGRGEFLLAAKQAGWRSYGIDNSSESVELGLKLGLETSLFDGSFKTKLSFPDTYFDVITMQSVLEHVHYPIEAIQECFRLLKPGGLLIVVVPNLDSYDRKVLGSSWSLWDQPKHLFHFNEETLEILLSKVGFVCEKVVYKKTAKITENKSLAKLRSISKNRLTYLKISFLIRYGKRIYSLLGFLDDSEVAQNIAIYGRKPE